MGFVRCPDREARDEQARILYATGLGYRKVAAILGCSHETVREAVRPGVKKRSNARRAAYNTSAAGLERQRKYRARKAQ